MITIKAKINFNIVEQVKRGDNFNELIKDYPAEIICTELDDRAVLAKSVLNDPYLNRRYVEIYNETREKAV